MDRGIVYPGQIPLDTDILNTNQRTMIALGYALQALLGTGTVVDGLACIPTTPASLSVIVGPGSITSLENIEATTYGSLPSDTTDPLMKMGINTTSTTFPVTAPGTSGQSINYLIEATFEEEDTTPVVLPYYNSSLPSQPYSGPANSGGAQNTTRKQLVELQLKNGAAANTGTQTTPAVDAGWVGLYVITVNYGQTQVTSSSISVYPGAPFLAAKLPTLAWGAALWPDTGTANAVAVTLTPPPASMSALVGVPLKIRKGSAANTGATTINLNGLGNITAQNPDGSALANGQWPANGIATVVFDGTELQFQSATTAATTGWDAGNVNNLGAGLTLTSGTLSVSISLSGYATESWTTAAIVAATSSFFGTLSNVTGSRSFGVTYTNSTGGPMFVTATGYSSGTYQNISLEVNGTTVSSFWSGGTGGGVYLTVSGVVPPGATYIVNTGATGPENWTETY